MPNPSTTRSPATTPATRPTNIIDRAGPGLVPLVIVLALTVAVSVRDPHAPGSWLVCPSRALFGLDCPGCGSMRGLHDLAHGNLAESVGHNALLIPGILFLVYAIFRRPGSRWAIAWGAMFVVFTVLRNLPGSPLAA